jgi:hypothetical protein
MDICGTQLRNKRSVASSQNDHQVAMAGTMNRKIAGMGLCTADGIQAGDDE